MKCGPIQPGNHTSRPVGPVRERRRRRPEPSCSPSLFRIRQSAFRIVESHYAGGRGTPGEGLRGARQGDGNTTRRREEGFTLTTKKRPGPPCTWKWSDRNLTYNATSPSHEVGGEVLWRTTAGPQRRSQADTLGNGSPPSIDRNQSTLRTRMLFSPPIPRELG